MENKLPTPEQVQQNVIDLKNELKEALDINFKENIEQIIGKPLSLEERNLIVENVTREVLEKVPNAVFEPIPIERVGGGYQLQIFRTVVKRLQEYHFIPEKPSEEQFIKILDINDDVAQKTFNLALNVHEQTKDVYDYLNHQWQSNLQKTYNLEKEDAINMAQEITDKTWYRLSAPELATPTEPHIQEKLADIYLSSAEEVVRKHNLQNTPIQTLSANIAQQTTPLVQPIICSPLFDNSREYYGEIRHNIYNRIIQKGIKGEEALSIADQITKKIVDKSIDFSDITNEELKIKKIQDSAQQILEENLKKTRVIKPEEIKTLSQSIGGNIITPLNNFHGAPTVIPLTDLLPIARNRAFEFLYVAFDPDKSTKYVEEHVLKAPLEYFVKIVLKEPTGSIEEWLLGKGEKVLFPAIAGPFANSLKLSLKGVTSEKIQDLLGKYTGTTTNDRLYRLINGIPNLPSNDKTTRLLQQQLAFLQAFEKHHPVGKLLKKFNIIKNKLAPEWNIRGLDVLKLKPMEILLVAINDPQKIPEIIADQIKKHVIKLTIERTLNTIGVKLGLYKVVNLGSGGKLILFEGHNLLLKPFKGIYKYIISPLFKKAVGSSVGLFIKLQLKKLAQSRLGLAVKVIIGAMVKIGAKLLAFLSGVFTIVGIIMVIRDIIKIIVPVLKKILEGVAKVFIGMYLLLAQFGLWGIIGGMVGGIAGAVVGFMIGGPIGMIAGYFIGTLVGGFALGYLIPTLSAVLSAISSAIASILGTLASITSTIFSLATLSTISIALALGSIISITVISSAPPPESEAKYIEIKVTASPDSLSAPAGTAKFSVEIKPGNSNYSRQFRLENLTIKDTMSVFTKDETKEIQYKKNGVDKGGCKEINDELTSMSKLEPNEICTYSFSANVAELINSFGGSGSSTTNDYTVALLVSANADIFDVGYDQILTYASDETKRSASGFIKIGAGGGKLPEEGQGQPEPTRPGQLPNVPELPSGWPIKSGTVSQGPDTCRTIFNINQCVRNGAGSHGFWGGKDDETESVDIYSSRGDKVYATHTGYLTYKWTAGGFTAIVQSNYNGKTITTYYMHLIDSPQVDIPPNGGKIVQKGTLIGLEDNTVKGGRSTGTHVHYQLDPSAGYQINQMLPVNIKRGCITDAACNVKF